MASNTYYIKADKRDKSTVFDIVVNEVQNNSGYKTKVDRGGPSDSSRVEASHNIVNVDYFNGSIRVEVNTTDQIDTAIEMALKSQFGEGSVGRKGEEKSRYEKDRDSLLGMAQDEPVEPEMSKTKFPIVVASGEGRTGDYYFLTLSDNGEITDSDEFDVVAGTSSEVEAIEWMKNNARNKTLYVGQRTVEVLRHSAKGNYTTQLKKVYQPDTDSDMEFIENELSKISESSEPRQTEERDTGIVKNRESSVQGDVAAEMTLYEDGKLEVTYDNKTEVYHTAAGAFLATKEGSRAGGRPLALLDSYVEDDFSYTDQEIQRALQEIEDYLRSENR